MIQDLLPLLPEPTRAATTVAIAGSLVGAGLWLVGARFSRRLVALAAVGIGAALGMALPRWCGWTVHPMAGAVGGAVALGFTGFAWHKLWVGLGLGLVLAWWAALATWVIVGGDATRQPFDWPTMTATVPEYLQAVWNALPATVQRFLPYACGSAMITGLSATLLWPKAGIVLMYSSGGISLLLGMGLAAIEYGRPDWLRLVPGTTWAQVLLLVCLVAFGAIVQWQTQPATPAGGKPRNSNDGSDGDDDDFDED